MTQKFAEYVYSMQDTIEVLVTTHIIPALKDTSQSESTKALIACVEKTKLLLKAALKESEDETERLRKQLKVLEDLKSERK